VKNHVLTMIVLISLSFFYTHLSSLSSFTKLRNLFASSLVSVPFPGGGTRLDFDIILPFCSLNGSMNISNYMKQRLLSSFVHSICR
jgi:hypothetical protein